MFFLDEIICAVESVSMLVEEKVDRLQDPTFWSGERSSRDDEEEEDKEVIEDKDEETDFDRYLQECALGVLNTPVIFADKENQSVSNDKYDTTRLKVKAQKLNSMYKESKETDQYVQMIRNLKLLIAIIKKCRDETVHRNDIRNCGAELADWQMNLSDSDRQGLLREIEKIEQLLLFMEKNIEGKLQGKDMTTAAQEIESWKISVKKMKGYFGFSVL